jgi:hypothetical protein
LAIASGKFEEKLNVDDDDEDEDEEDEEDDDGEEDDDEDDEEAGEDISFAGGKKTKQLSPENQKGLSQIFLFELRL